MNKKMINAVSLFFATLILLPAPFTGAYQSAESYETSNEQMIPNTGQMIDVENVFNRQIMIKMKGRVDFNFHSLGVEQIDLSPLLLNRGFLLVKVPEITSYQKKLEEIRLMQGVVFAEPEYINKIAYTPSDPYFKEQWYMNKLGMRNAWDLTRGSPSIIVAVLDTGVNTSHPDLTGRVLQGYDFINNHSNQMDDHGHGTQVAGIIAANANKMGVVGIDHYSMILPVKIAGKNGLITTSNIVNGIYYAIEQGADVINMSFGSSYPSEAEKEALWEAFNKGIVLVAAAGNDGDTTLQYPASYPQVISVAATNRHDVKASFSNYGNLIDVSGPGVDILSTHFNGSYVFGDGTSFAAPIVSGIAALIKAKNPTWGPLEIEWALEKGAVQVSGGTGWNQSYGFGRVNAYDSLIMPLPDRSNDIPDMLANAFTLPRSTSYEEKLDFPLDKDWYKVNLPQSTDARVEINGYPLEQEVMFISESGEAIHSDKIRKINEETFYIEASGRTLYIGVTDRFNHWSTVPYTIKVDSFIRLNLDQPVFQDEKAISGIAEPNVWVYVYKKGTNTGLIGRSQVKSDGTFSVAIPPQITGSTLEVYVENAEGVKSSPIEVTVQRNSNFAFSDIMLYQKEILFLSDLRIIQGYQDETFKPEQYVKRLQAVQMILREMGLDKEIPKTEPYYKDLKPGDYGYKEVAIATELGFITGKVDGTFDPFGILTRAQMAKILSMAYSLPQSKSETTSFKDIPADFWAIEYINSIKVAKITTGYPDGTYRPNEKISRQHFALFLARYLDNSHNLGALPH